MNSSRYANILLVPVGRKHPRIGQWQHVLSKPYDTNGRLLPHYFFGSLRACPLSRLSLSESIMTTSTFKATLELAHGIQHAV